MLKKLVLIAAAAFAVATTVSADVPIPTCIVNGTCGPTGN
jgi:hypothetical protein